MDPPHPHRPITTSPSTLDSKSTPPVAKHHKTMWTPEMENTALELYVRAVQDGKRSDNGFVPDTHRSIARKLNELFPNIELDEKKVKSKYNQGFKKDYDTLKALRSAGGFEWSENTCEATGSDESWNQHLMSHPQAKKFRNNPFPQSRQLEILFGPYSQPASRSEPISFAPSFHSFAPLRTLEHNFIPHTDNHGPMSEGETPISHTRSRSRSPSRSRPYFAAPLDRFTDITEQPRPRTFSELTKVEQAVDQLQEEFAHLLNEMELLKALCILESDIKAQVFLRLRTHELRFRWLQQQFRNLRDI